MMDQKHENGRLETSANIVVHLIAQFSGIAALSGEETWLVRVER